MRMLCESTRICRNNPITGFDFVEPTLQAIVRQHRHIHFVTFHTVQQVSDLVTVAGSRAVIVRRYRYCRVYFVESHTDSVGEMKDPGRLTHRGLSVTTY